MFHKIVFLILPLLVLGKPGSTQINSLVYREGVYEEFKDNLIRFYGIDEDFALQFKENLKKAVEFEINQRTLRQGNLDEEDEDDETEAPTTTTEGASPFNIVNGIYGILSGVGTLSPNRIFESTVNFFPPSQKQTAQALIDQALGNQAKFPPPTTTKLTSTTPSTTTKDEDYDEDEDESTKSAAATAATTARIVIPKYTIYPKDPATPASVAVTPSGSLILTTVQDDESDFAKAKLAGNYNFTRG